MFFAIRVLQEGKYPPVHVTGEASQHPSVGTVSEHNSEERHDDKRWRGGSKNDLYARHSPVIARLVKPKEGVALRIRRMRDRDGGEGDSAALQVYGAQQRTSYQTDKEDISGG